jgi:hypothetical protein
MFWSWLASARLGFSSLVVLTVLAAAPIFAQEAREPEGRQAPEEPAAPGEEAKEGRQVEEVIIDDSGIILRQEGEDIEVEVEGDSSGGFNIDVSTDRSRSRNDGQLKFGEDQIVRAHEVVQEDMVVLFGDLTVYGKVVGDIVVLYGDVRLFDGAEVTGDIVCIGGDVDQEEGAQVFGEITPVRVTKNLPRILGPALGLGHYREDDHRREGVGSAFWRLLSILILAWVGMVILRTRVPNLSLGLKTRPGHSLLLGFLTFLAFLLLLVPLILFMVLVALTVIGIPVVVLAIIGLIGLGFLGWLVPLYTFSRYTFEARGMGTFLSVGLWAVIFWSFHTLGQAMNIGWLFAIVEFLVLLFGIGAMVITRLGARRVLAS